LQRQQEEAARKAEEEAKREIERQERELALEEQRRQQAVVVTPLPRLCDLHHMLLMHGFFRIERTIDCANGKDCQLSLPKLVLV